MMKINRLIEITIILLNRRTITASELSKRFNVSTRTIYRDIDVLSGSGVPVFCTQGLNGGISILDNYTINRASLSEKESEQIIFALQSLMATKYPEIELILDKLGALFNSSSKDWISIDFTRWGSSPNEFNRFNLIKDAILKQNVIEFTYINADNIKSNRKIAPLRLMFKSQSWYLWGFCYNRKDYRTFRITRIRSVETTETHFERNDFAVLIQNTDEKEVYAKSNINLSLQFTKQALSRLYDDFEDKYINACEDGTYLVNVTLPEDEWVYGYILSFGSYVKVLSPPHIQDIIIKKSLAAISQYKK